MKSELARSRALEVARWITSGRYGLRPGKPTPEDIEALIKMWQGGKRGRSGR